MSRPPRKTTESLFGRRSLFISLGLGFTALACVLGIWYLAGAAGLPVETQRTLSFVTLIVSNLAIILSTRSWNSGLIASFAAKNPAVPWVVGGAAAFLSLIVALPFLRELFHFGEPGAAWILVACACGLASIAWFEGLKFVAWLRGKSLL